MRHVALILGVVFLAGLAGCSSTRWGFVKNNDRPTTPAAPGEVPSAAQLVEWMNDNAGRMKSLRVDDLVVTCSVGKGITTQSTDLRGKLVTEKPKNFRMGASVIGSPVVDLGSNEQEFWYWISKANPPYQVYCSYKDLNEGKVRQMPFPFQPEWVMESMGLGPYGPADKYTVEAGRDNTLKLVERTTSPQGAPVRKVIVFNSKPVKAPTPQITDFLLLDDAGKEICAAHITDVQLDKATGAVIPKRIQLRWPSENLKLDMRMDGALVNPPVSAQTFTRQTGSGIQSFNLARGQVDNSPPPQAYSGADNRIRPVQGFGP